MAFARSSSGPAGLSINTGAANSLWVPFFLFPSMHPFLPLPCCLAQTDILLLLCTVAHRVSLQQAAVYLVQPARRSLQPKPALCSAAIPSPPPSPPRLPLYLAPPTRIKTQTTNNSSSKQVEEVSLGLLWHPQQNLAACLAPQPRAQHQRQEVQVEVFSVLPRRRRNLSRPEGFSDRQILLPNHNKRDRRADCLAVRPPQTRHSHSRQPVVSLARPHSKGPLPLYSDLP